MHANAGVHLRQGDDEGVLQQVLVHDLTLDGGAEVFCENSPPGSILIASSAFGRPDRRVRARTTTPKETFPARPSEGWRRCAAAA